MSILINLHSIEDLVNYLGGVEEVADNFNLSERSVYRWISGDVPIHRKHYKLLQKLLKLNRLELIDLLKSLE